MKYILITLLFFASYSVAQDTTYIRQYRAEFKESIEDSIVFLIQAYINRDIHYGLEESILIKEIRKLKYSKPTLEGYEVWLNKKRKLR